MGDLQVTVWRCVFVINTTNMAGRYNHYFIFLSYPTVNKVGRNQNDYQGDVIDHYVHVNKVQELIKK